MSELTGPSQAVLVTARAIMEDKFSTKKITKDNIITIAWHMNTSSSPQLYAISVGKTRYSYKLISSSRVFAVNFMPYDLKEKTIKCGRVSGEHIDKFREAGLTKIEADKIDCLLIGEALGYLECEVINEIEAGDHVIFIGHVLRSELKEQDHRLYHITGDRFTTTKRLES